MSTFVITALSILVALLSIRLIRASKTVESLQSEVDLAQEDYANKGGVQYIIPTGSAAVDGAAHAYIEAAKYIFHNVSDYDDMTKVRTHFKERAAYFDNSTDRPIPGPESFIDDDEYMIPKRHQFISGGGLNPNLCICGKPLNDHR